MAVPNTNDDDPLIVGLMALAWTLGDERRADRLLGLTGLNAADLRDRAGEPAVLAAVLRFLEQHEPDLIACADAIGYSPQQLIASAQALDGEGHFS